MVWTGGRYAHMSATPDGFSDRIWVVLDLSDPGRRLIPRGRWRAALAYAVSVLAARDAGFITGQRILVDGGRSLTV